MTRWSAIFGPKVMLINQNSGSGGDADAREYFRKAGVHAGKLVGTRTWGELVGIGGYPTLLDGRLRSDRATRSAGQNGDWEVEKTRHSAGCGMWSCCPKTLPTGMTSSLRNGVRLVLEELKANPVPEIKPPTPPNYHKTDGLEKD